MALSYAQPSISLSEYLERLANHIISFPTHFKAYSEEELTAKEVGKWSKKEILGHLIDSAVNNLKRFTDAQASEQPYAISGYQQNHLVVVNRYQSLPVNHLIGLWQAINQQILYVATAIPEQQLQTSVVFSDGQTATLSYIIEDYIAHLEHHFKTLI